MRGRSSSPASSIYLECRVPREIAAARLRQRGLSGVDASDATPAIQEAQAAAYEACAPGEAIAIDAAGEPDAVLEKALTALRAAVPATPDRVT